MTPLSLTRIPLRRLRFLTAIATASLLLGCQSMAPKPIMTLDDVVRMSQEGKPVSEIIGTLENSRVQANLSGSQLARLKEQGVSDAVLDYLFNVYSNNLRYQSRLEAEPYWWHHPFYYGPPQVIIVERPRK